MLRSYCYLLAMLSVSLSVVLGAVAMIAPADAPTRTALLIICIGCWPLVFGFLYLAALTPRTDGRNGQSRLRRIHWRR